MKYMLDGYIELALPGSRIILLCWNGLRCTVLLPKVFLTSYFSTLQEAYGD